MTSPPLARIVLISPATWVSEETGSDPSQDGVQPPPARMKAISNAFVPVADMTWPKSTLESMVL